MTGTVIRPPARLYTARFLNPNLAEHPGAKVRITLTGPRFRLPYPLAGTIVELAPTRSMFGMPEAEFEDFYRKLVERRGGIHFFAARFAQVAQEADVDSLILLCYENLRKPGVWCHRRVFADFWSEQTGQVVQELLDGPEQLEL